MLREAQRLASVADGVGAAGIVVAPTRRAHRERSP